MSKLKSKRAPARPVAPPSAPVPPRPSRLRRRLLTAGAIALAAGGWVGGAELLSARKLREAESLATKREFPEARRRFDELLRADPTSGRVLFEAGRAARRDGDFLAARLLLDRAAGAGWPADAVASERALLAAQSGSFAAIEPKLRATLEAAPDHPDADLVREVLAPNYLAAFDLGRAYRLLDDWSARSPADARVRLWLAEASRRLLGIEAAFDPAAEAARLDPENPAARRLAGELLIDNHRPADARPHFDWLLGKNPDDPGARLGRARCLRESGDTAAAAIELDKLVEGRPHDGKALAERGYCDLVLGNPVAAAERLGKAAALNPAEPEVLYNLALALDQCGKPAEATAARAKQARAAADLVEMTRVVKAVAAAPRDLALRHQAGAIMLRNGQGAEGVRWLESALALDPRHEPSRRALAEYRAGAK